MLISSGVVVERTVTECKRKIKSYSSKSFKLERKGALPDMETRVENVTRRGIFLFNFETFGNVVKKSQTCTHLFLLSPTVSSSSKKSTMEVYKMCEYFINICFSVMFIFNTL